MFNQDGLKNRLQVLSFRKFMTLAVMLAEQKCNYYFLILCYKVPGPLTMGDKWTFCKPQASLEWIAKAITVSTEG